MEILHVCAAELAWGETLVSIRGRIVGGSWRIQGIRGMRADTPRET